MYYFYYHQKFKNMTKRMKLLCSISLLGIFCITVGCGGCGGVKRSKDTLENRNSKEDFHNSLSSNSSETTLSTTDDLKAAQRHLEDSILNSGAKVFTINEKTGEVVGCPYLKLVGVYSSMDLWREDSMKAAREKEKFQRLLPKLEKAWLGTKEIVISEEFPEGEDSYPRSGYFSLDGKYLIVPDGMAHGGYTDKLYFFDNQGNLLKKYSFPEPLIAYMGFNSENTHFWVQSQTKSEYWFFTSSGKLVRKSNNSLLTETVSTPIGFNNVSKKGTFWLLGNTNLYHENGSLIAKIRNESEYSIINEDFDLLSYIRNNQIKIADIRTNKILFYSNAHFKNLIMHQDAAYISFNDYKTYKYEISK